MSTFENNINFILNKRKVSDETVKNFIESINKSSKKESLNYLFRMILFDVNANELLLHLELKTKEILASFFNIKTDSNYISYTNWRKNNSLTYINDNNEIVYPNNLTPILIDYLLTTPSDQLPKDNNAYLDTFNIIINKSKDNLKQPYFNFEAKVYFFIEKLIDSINKDKNKPLSTSNIISKSSPDRSPYRAQFYQMKLNNNPYKYNYISYNPYYIPIFSGGNGNRYKYKPNDNQTAKILRRVFDNILKNLNYYNKKLTDRDKEIIYSTIDKIEDLENIIGMRFTEMMNYIQSNPKKEQENVNIDIDKLAQEYAELQEKQLTLKQKIDKILSYILEQEKEKAATNAPKPEIPNIITF